jgi:hypothetical protein
MVAIRTGIELYCRDVKHQYCTQGVGSALSNPQIEKYHCNISLRQLVSDRTTGPEQAKMKINTFKSNFAIGTHKATKDVNKIKQEEESA